VNQVLFADKICAFGPGSLSEWSSMPFECFLWLYWWTWNCFCL